jgi:hypothetical protein
MRIVTRSTARRTAIGVVAALSLLCGGAYAVRGARSRAKFTLHANPSARTIKSGASTKFRIAIRRAHFSGIVSLRLGRGMPAHAFAKISPSSTHGASAMLTIRTSSRTAPGHYQIHLHGRSKSATKSLAVKLTVKAGGTSGSAGPVRVPPFTVTARADDLVPGVTRPLDLAITNPSHLALSVTALSARPQSVTAPNATPALPCRLADFSVRQFSGPSPLRIAAASTRTLSSLGVPSTLWPAVTLVDRPVDQDGCRGATLNLVYAGTATLG